LKLNKQYYEIQIEKYKKLVKELRETKGIIWNQSIVLIIIISLF
jgi:hypothetical protein